MLSVMYFAVMLQPGGHTLNFVLQVWNFACFLLFKTKFLQMQHAALGHKVPCTHTNEPIASRFCDFQRSQQRVGNVLVTQIWIMSQMMTAPSSLCASLLSGTGRIAFETCSHTV